MTSSRTRSSQFSEGASATVRSPSLRFLLSITSLFVSLYLIMTTLTLDVTDHYPSWNMDLVVLVSQQQQMIQGQVGTVQRHLDTTSSTVIDRHQNVLSSSLSWSSLPLTTKEEGKGNQSESSSSSKVDRTTAFPASMASRIQRFQRLQRRIEGARQGMNLSSKHNHHSLSQWKNNNNNDTLVRRRRHDIKHAFFQTTIMTGRAPGTRTTTTTRKWPQQPPHSSVVQNTTPEEERNNHTKWILFYSTSSSKRDLGFGSGFQPFESCPSAMTRDCHLTTNSHHHKQQRRHLYNLSKFDAVLFHPDGGVPSRSNMAASTWRWRRPHQRFVLLQMESPVYQQNRYLEGTTFDAYPHFFNWTMTYHWDSDIPRPYGWFQDKMTLQHQEKPEQTKRPTAATTRRTSSSQSVYPFLREPSDWVPYNATAFRESLPLRPKAFRALADRPGQVAWVVSHCRTDSKREEYVKLLQKYINVTILGRCADDHGNFVDHGKRRDQQGRPVIPKKKDYNNQSIWDRVERDYKFYLGFENAFCNDYVTEKLFARMHKMVVIVLGQADYRRIAPPHSYINIWGNDGNDDNDKNNNNDDDQLLVWHPQKLAAFLQRLSSNPTEYLSYFWWQDHYTLWPKSFAKADRLTNFAQAFCRLCQRLHEENDPAVAEAQPHSSYQNISVWWKQKGQCRSKSLHPEVLLLK